MNKYLWFAIGLVSGAVATYIVVKDEFERICDEEIESIREMYHKMGSSKQKAIENDDKKEAYMDLVNREKYNYSKPVKNIKEKNEKIDGAVDEKKEEKVNTQQPVKHNIFSDYESTESEDEEDEDEEIENEKEVMHVNKTNLNSTSTPFTITPELFVNDMREYDKITLEYYDDGFLVEEITSDIIPDIQTTVTYEALNKFGEYEEDVVYVRNDQLSTDYEIIRQHCNYADS